MKTSAPRSRTMKPKPLSSLNHFTVPCSAILLLLAPNETGLLFLPPGSLGWSLDRRQEKNPRSKSWRPPACAFYTRVFTRSAALAPRNPNRSPFGIHCRDTAPTETGFAKPVGDDFPVSHAPIGKRRTSRLVSRSGHSNDNSYMHCMGHFPCKWRTRELLSDAGTL